MYFDPVEKATPWELERLQTSRLKAVVALAAKSPFYGPLLSGLNPDDIRSPADVTRLPLTTKDDLRGQYPYGFLSCPPTQLARLHASSGTTGAPTATLYTRQDLTNWASLVARSLYATGIRPGDVFQNIAGYGMFTGGLGFHYGAEHLGCLTILAGAGNTRRCLKLINDFQVSAVHIIPSYALYLGGVLEREGVSPEDFPVKIACIGAEPHTDEARRRIEAMLGVKAFNSYGLTEMNGPGVAFECREQSGMHIWEDAYLVEVLDPVTGQAVAEGETGELVLTTLTRQGMPLLRYRTRDLTRIVTGDCPCGRTHKRIDRIAGRTDDMIIIKGVNIYPMQVEQVLMSMPEAGDNYLILIEREGYLDQLRVQVEIREEFFVEDMRALRGLQQTIARRLHDELLITPRVDLVQHGTIERPEGKAKRVVDLRGK